MTPNAEVIHFLEAFGVDPEVQHVPHLSCDICAHDFKCGTDSCNDLSFKIAGKKTSERVKCRETSEEDRSRLQVNLVSLRECNLQHEGSLYSGRAITSALSFEVIDNIVEEIDYIGSSEILQTRYSYFIGTAVLGEINVDTVGPSAAEVIQESHKILEDTPIEHEDDVPHKIDTDLRGHLLDSSDSDS